MRLRPLNREQYDDSEQFHPGFNARKKYGVINIFRDGDELQFRNMTQRYVGMLGLLKLTSKCVMQMTFLCAGICIGLVFFWLCARGGCRAFYEINDLFAR